MTETEAVAEVQEAREKVMSETRILLNSLMRNRTAMIGLVLFSVYVGMAILAPYISPFSPLTQDFTTLLSPPTSKHLLGTDELGRDILSRIIWGARISVSVGIAVVAISALTGSFVGMVAGYYRGRVENVIMRIVDVFLAFPSLILAIAVAAILGASLISVIAALMVTSWAAYARVMRSQTMVLRELDYVKASRAMGSSNLKIILNHVLPNAVGSVIVLATLSLGLAILGEAGLSFLGIGIPPPSASWGNMLSAGRIYITTDPLYAVFPGLAITMSVLGLNLLGDGLRDALDPRMRV